MIAIIDKVDSGKTRKLLKMCSLADGLFICAHPEKVLDKCKAYDIKPAVRSASFAQIPDLLDKEDSIYIDDIDKLVKFLDATYKEEADIYLSDILLKTKGYSYSCEDNVSYIRKITGDR